MNNLFQQLNPGGTSSNSMSQMIQMLRGSNNPGVLLQRMAQQNPQVQQVLQLVQQNGGDAKTAFYNLAKQRGIDPNTILNQLK